MTRFKLWASIGVILAVLTIAITLSIPQATASSILLPKGNRPDPPPAKFDVSKTYMPGTSGIPVQGANRTTPNYTNISSTPKFTTADVIAFINKNGFSAPLVQGATLKFLTVQFVTAKQASVLMVGESVGRPDNYLVCYVKVQGPFQLMGLHMGPHLPNRKKPKTTADTGDMVFDGQTGNIIMWGVYP
jgi:hypothetical protein